MERYLFSTQTKKLLPYQHEALKSINLTKVKVSLVKDVNSLIDWLIDLDSPHWSYAKVDDSYYLASSVSRILFRNENLLDLVDYAHQYPSGLEPVTEGLFPLWGSMSDDEQIQWINGEISKRVTKAFSLSDLVFLPSDLGEELNKPFLITNCHKGLYAFIGDLKDIRSYIDNGDTAVSIVDAFIKDELFFDIGDWTVNFVSVDGVSSVVLRNWAGFKVQLSLSANSTLEEAAVNESFKVETIPAPTAMPEPISEVSMSVESNGLESDTLDGSDRSDFSVADNKISSEMPEEQKISLSEGDADVNGFSDDFDDLIPEEDPKSTEPKHEQPSPIMKDYSVNHFSGFVEDDFEASNQSQKTNLNLKNEGVGSISIFHAEDAVAKRREAEMSSMNLLNTIINNVSKT